MLVALLALLRRWRRRHMRGNLTGSGIGGTTARAGGALSVDGLAASCVTGAAVAGTAAAGAVSSAKTSSMADQHATVAVVSGSQQQHRPRTA